MGVVYTYMHTREINRLDLLGRKTDANCNPTIGGRLSQHFGHSEQFLFVDADLEQKQVLGKKVETAPEHAPGVLPTWLAEHGVNVVIASGMGARARDLLEPPVRCRC